MTVVPPFALEFSDDVVREFTAACTEIARSGVLTLGTYTTRFESQVAALAGSPHAVAVTSGTTALELTFEALGLNRGVILIPTNTNAATAAAAVRAGHRIRFYDTGLWATVGEISEAFDDAVDAVVLVHIGGFVSPEVEAIAQFCRERGVRLIEDAAHAHGSAHGGRPAGSFGDAAAFSFFPTKVVTTAEGGVVTTADPKVADAVRRLRNQGQLNGSTELVGGSYRLSEFGAALGAVQLNHRDEWLAAQWSIFDRYRDAVNGLSFATVAPIPETGQISGYKFIALAATPDIREGLRAYLEERGIKLAGGVYEKLLHEDARFRDYTADCAADFSVARDFADRHFCLPAWPGLSDTHVDLVIAALETFDRA